MITVTITLTQAGTDTGPFDLYYNFNNLIENNVDKSLLINGYDVQVPETATSIRVQSDSVNCNNYIDILIPQVTTSTTTTSTTTTSTTTTTTIATRNTLKKCGDDSTNWYLSSSSLNLSNGQPIGNDIVVPNTRVQVVGETSNDYYIVTGTTNNLSSLTEVIGEVTTNTGCPTTVEISSISIKGLVSGACNSLMPNTAYVEGLYYRVWQDSSATIPFNGGNKYWRVSKQSDSNSVSVLIDTGGYVVAIEDCLTTTTSTTTTTTTTTLQGSFFLSLRSSLSSSSASNNVCDYVLSRSCQIYSNSGNMSSNGYPGTGEIVCNSASLSDRFDGTNGTGISRWWKLAYSISQSDEYYCRALINDQGLITQIEDPCPIGDLL